jgi:hypothetical protein
MKNLAVIAILSLMCIAYNSTAQVVGKTFPDMPTETVDDKKINLPHVAKGKYTLLGLAYSKKSEEELNTWFQPIFEKFIQKTKGIFAGFEYDVNVYFVPMFTGVNAAATGTAKKKALEKVDQNLLPHILFYKGELKSYKESLDFEKKDVPYFFVLDKDGKILYATSGKYIAKKMDEIEAVMEEE